MASIASLALLFLLLGVFAAITEGAGNDARSKMDALLGCLINKAGAEPEMKGALGNIMSKLFGDKCALNAEQTAEIAQSSLQFTPKNISDFANRLYDAGMSCLLDGEDFGECCKNNGVADSCMSLCGRKGAQALGPSDANFCKKYGHNIIKCHINATDAGPKTVQYSLIPCPVERFISEEMPITAVVPVAGPIVEAAWTVVSMLDSVVEDVKDHPEKLIVYGLSVSLFGLAGLFVPDIIGIF